MRKISIVLMMLFILAIASPVYAADGGAAASGIGNGFLAVLGLGCAVAGAGIGQGKIGAAACESIARNPGARSGIQTAFILGLAFVESLVLFVWVMVLIKAK
jgi:F-type H+-transporting ATPase subunit c